MTAWTRRRAALAGLVAAALTMSALGPCHCLGSDAACRRVAETPDAHACCEKPTGVQAAADECCGSGSELVAASTEVPEVAPPILRISRIFQALPGGQSTPVATVRTPPPLSLERTTVLLI